VAASAASLLAAPIVYVTAVHFPLAHRGATVAPARSRSVLLAAIGLGRI
jgi:hypothetical protein